MKFQNPEKFQDKLHIMKAEEKQRDIEKHLLSLSVKENVLDKREISERIQKLRSSIPR